MIIILILVITNIIFKSIIMGIRNKQIMNFLKIMNTTKAKATIKYK